MENLNTIFEPKYTEQTGLTLRLAYMVEDFMELIKREEQEEPVSKEN